MTSLRQKAPCGSSGPLLHPHPTNGDLPPAPFGPAVRGPARFDLHIERSPSPLTSIASSDSEGEEGDESSDSSDEDDESVDQTLPRGGVSQTAGAGPSTFPPPKRTSSELKEGRMHKCPNGYAGCLKTFKTRRRCCPAYPRLYLQPNQLHGAAHS